MEPDLEFLRDFLQPAPWRKPLGLFRRNMDRLRRWWTGPIPLFEKGAVIAVDGMQLEVTGVSGRHVAYLSDGSTITMRT